MRLLMTTKFSSLHHCFFLICCRFFQWADEASFVWPIGSFTAHPLSFLSYIISLYVTISERVAPSLLWQLSVYFFFHFEFTSQIDFLIFISCAVQPLAVLTVSGTFTQWIKPPRTSFRIHFIQTFFVLLLLWFCAVLTIFMARRRLFDPRSQECFPIIATSLWLSCNRLIPTQRRESFLFAFLVSPSQSFASSTCFFCTFLTVSFLIFISHDTFTIHLSSKLTIFYSFPFSIFYSFFV